MVTNRTSILLNFFLLFTLVSARAQVNQAGSMQTLKLDERSVVTDTAGNRLPFTEWRQLLSTGMYGLRMKRDSSSKIATGVLYQRSIPEMMEAADRLNNSTSEGPVSRFFSKGERLFNFSVKDVVTGQAYKSKDLAGKVIVMNFWFIDCPPCRAEIPRLNGLAALYKDNPDVVFIAIALDDPFDLRDFLKHSPFLYHIASAQYLVRNKGINLFPTNVVAGRDGRVLTHSSGGLISPGINYMKKTIDEALAVTYEAPVEKGK